VFQRDVAEGIHRIEDAGLPTSGPSLEDALEKLGRGFSDVPAIALTHAHFDHLGIAERARRELGVPVWVHENDAPLTKQPRQYVHERARLFYVTRQFRAAPIVASLLGSRAWWPEPVKEVKRYTNGTLPGPGSPEVVFTPEHTLGH
jgi:glyoxylase-like metal-dependent hydrolase (beta-lactamase superfamily II)